MENIREFYKQKGLDGWKLELLVAYVSAKGLPPEHVDYTLYCLGEKEAELHAVHTITGEKLDKMVVWRDQINYLKKLAEVSRIQEGNPQ
jgi:hypothetical protein